MESTQDEILQQANTPTMNHQVMSVAPVQLLVAVHSAGNQQKGE